MAADVEPAPAIRQRKPKTYDGLGERRAMGEFRGRETAKGKQSVGARNRQADRQIDSGDGDRVRVRDGGWEGGGGVQRCRELKKPQQRARAL